jgi:hypothetical protein
MTLKQNIVRATIVSNDDLEKKLFIIVASVFALLIASYIFFIGRITFAVVATRGADAQVRTLRAHVGDLELQYLTLNQKVDMAYAESHGFSEPKDTSFAAKARLSVASDSNDTGHNEL